MNACVLQAGVGVRTAAARGREVRRLRVQSYHHAAVSAAVGYAEGACAKTPASGSVPVPSVTSQGAQRVAPPPGAAASVPVAVSTDGSVPLIHTVTRHCHRWRRYLNTNTRRPDERNASIAHMSACVLQAGVSMRVCPHDGGGAWHVLHGLFARMMPPSVLGGVICSPKCTTT